MFGQFYCTLHLAAGQRVSAIDRHHLIYPDNCFVPLCRDCHILVTNVNTFYAFHVTHRKLTREQREYIFWMGLQTMAATLVKGLDGATADAMRALEAELGPDAARDELRKVDGLILRCYQRTLDRFNASPRQSLLEFPRPN